MKLKSAFILIFAILAVQLTFSQSVENAFGKRKETYFSFKIQSKEEIHTLTKIISIDNVVGNTVWAYANINEFLKFMKMGYDITLLPSPGDVPGVEMKDHIDIRSPLTTWNFYPSYTAYETLMSDFQTNYPNICQVTTFGTLASGRKLMVAKISDNVATDEAEPEFLYTSSIHGDETTGYVLMLHLIDYLLSSYGTNSEVTDLINNMEIYINPLANPDGTYAGGSSSVSGATRGNANGVDMNRNYPDPQDGDHPDGNAWQPETMAFMNFATAHHFVASCNFHGGAEVVNYPWDTWSTLHADDNWCQYVCHEYADSARTHGNTSYLSDVSSTGITNGFAWYEVDGGRQDYMNYWHHCREITIELSSTKLVAASSLPTYWQYNYRSLILFMKEARYGIHGLITDAVTGLPVAAKVFIPSHDVYNTETYSSANLGDYSRLIKAGTYTLEVSADNYLTKTITGVIVTDHNTTSLNIQLTPSLKPIVATTAATSVTVSTAILNGTVNPNNSATSYYFEWGLTTAYGNTTTSTSAGSGSSAINVNANLSGLSPSATYHFRVVAVNSYGTSYGNDLTFSTICGIVSTFPWTEGFENAGVIPNCWSNVQISSSGINWTFITGGVSSHPAAAHGGTYNACLKDATAADNKTQLISPTLNLSGASTATLTFWHTQAVWGSDQDKLIVYYKTSAGGAWSTLATYTASITAWTMETIILPSISSDYYIAFEGNAKYGYGVCIDDVSITTASTVPTVTTTAATSIAQTTATSGGSVTAQGGSAVTARGVCWATTTDPIVTGNHTTDGSGTGAFTSSITGLSPNTLYHVRAYATNTGGTAYGSDLQFTTLAALPTLTTTTPTSITSISASSGGTVTSDGGATVTARGVCWATTASPTTANSHTTDGTGTGTFTSSITGLTASTPYHVRAYATNSAGTSYGSDLQFTTTAIPTLGVTPSNQNVTSVAGATSYTVTSNSAWTAGSDQTWCTVTASGSGNGTITATYTENTSVTSRLATITVTVVGLTPLTVTVTQAGATPTLGVTPSNQAVTTPAGSTAFTVTSNTGWTSTSDQTWCTVTASGTGNGTLTATYSENQTTSTRVANITVTVSGLTPIIVTVTQAGAALPEFLLTAQNIVQTSATTLEFDVYLLDNNATSPFELATNQLGFLFNSGIYTGGSITASLVAGTSELSAAQAPTATPSIVSTLAGYPNQTLLRLAGRTPPGAGSGSIISTVSPGTRIIRLKLTSTVAFASSSVLNLVFTSSAATNPLYATRVNQYVGTTNTPLTVTPGYNANVIEPVPILNPPPTLSVTPANRDVLTGPGNTTFTVSSNAGWVATSNQAWCTVTPSGFGSGTITAVYEENTTSTTRVATITVTVSGLSPISVTVTQAGLSTKVLNLSLLLQGLYNGSGMMHPAMDESGAHWGLTIADKITVELHDNSNYSNLVYSVSNVDLHTDGTAMINIPPIYSGNYYITIRHRNSIETVSANPVSFSGSPVVYTFNLPTQAYGGNLGMMIDGKWVIYGGDVDQDGFIDTGDMAPVDNDSFNYLSGYLNSDTNGDGVIDTGDMVIVDNNASNYVSSTHP